MLALQVLLFSVLAVAFPVAIYFAVRKFGSYIGQKKTSERLTEGMRKAREGDIRTAVHLLLKAEKTWSLNSHDGGRQSLMRDLDDYSKISRSIFQVLHIHNGTVHEDVSGVVREMREHLANRNNFGVDGRRMKPDAAKRWHVMRQRLQQIRPRLREVCDPRILQ